MRVEAGRGGAGLPHGPRRSVPADLQAPAKRCLSNSRRVGFRPRLRRVVFCPRLELPPQGHRIIFFEEPHRSRVKLQPSLAIRCTLGAAGIAWAMAVGAGFFLLEAHQATPGEVADPPRRWPVDSRLALDPARANLVLLAHPRCPCTRASLAELERVLARCPGSVAVHVLFWRPGRSPEGWARTSLWHSAVALPNVRVLDDEDGVEARRFGARTSGHALLYDAKGRLLFSGGLTGSRGHQGDNAGRGSVISLLARGRADRERTDVFGCPLFGPRPRLEERAEECSNRP
jgi:hypothetical protein